MLKLDTREHSLVSTILFSLCSRYIETSETTGSTSSNYAETWHSRLTREHLLVSTIGLFSLCSRDIEMVGDVGSASKEANSWTNWYRGRCGLSSLAESVSTALPTISTIFDFKAVDSRYIEMVGDVGPATKEANSWTNNCTRGRRAIWFSRVSSADANYKCDIRFQSYWFSLQIEMVGDVGQASSEISELVNKLQLWSTGYESSLAESLVALPTKFKVRLSISM